MYQRIQPFVEIMDSTLRDGEQTSGVSFLPHEKLIIARMLLRDLNVDRIEVASARVSEGEKEAVSMICQKGRCVIARNNCIRHFRNMSTTLSKR